VEVFLNAMRKALQPNKEKIKELFACGKGSDVVTLFNSYYFFGLKRDSREDWTSFEPVRAKINPEDPKNPKDAINAYDRILDPSCDVKQVEDKQGTTGPQKIMREDFERELQKLSC